MSEKTRVVNLRKEPYDVYIGRRGRGQDGYFGNPFTRKEHGAEALTLYLNHMRDRWANDSEFVGRLLALQGKTLGCFCKPGPCHGDVIAQWLDGCARGSDGCMIQGPHDICGYAPTWTIPTRAGLSGAGSDR